jgi:hypothetical protein
MNPLVPTLRGNSLASRGLHCIHFVLQPNPSIQMPSQLLRLSLTYEYASHSHEDTILALIPAYKGQATTFSARDTLRGEKRLPNHNGRSLNADMYRTRRQNGKLVACRCNCTSFELDSLLVFYSRFHAGA